MVQLSLFGLPGGPPVIGITSTKCVASCQTNTHDKLVDSQVATHHLLWKSRQTMRMIPFTLQAILMSPMKRKILLASYSKPFIKLALFLQFFFICLNYNLSALPTNNIIHWSTSFTLQHSLLNGSLLINSAKFKLSFSYAKIGFICS